jgi:hypothetical protein
MENHERYNSYSDITCKHKIDITFYNLQDLKYHEFHNKLIIKKKSESIVSLINSSLKA